CRASFFRSSKKIMTQCINHVNMKWRHCNSATVQIQRRTAGRREWRGRSYMTVGVRHDDLRRRNRAMVIAAVRRASQPSRTEIAQATELSNSTISAIASDLIAEGVLFEVKAGEA